MRKVPPPPVVDVQNWLMVEKRLRPMLAELDFEPKDVEHAMAAAKSVYEKWNLHLDFVFNPNSRKEHFVADVVKASKGFYRLAIAAVLFEFAVREIRVHNCSCGKPARAGVDVLRT